jgi:hypothetical protein
LPDSLAAKLPRGDAVAYRCRGPVCSEPIDSLPALLGDLSSAPT